MFSSKGLKFAARDTYLFPSKLRELRSAKSESIALVGDASGCVTAAGGVDPSSQEVETSFGSSR